jgi:hypothetical protein
MSDSQDDSKMYGVKINPIKSANVRFSEGDKIIVLGEV